MMTAQPNPSVVLHDTLGQPPTASLLPLGSSAAIYTATGVLAPGGKPASIQYASLPSFPYVPR